VVKRKKKLVIVLGIRPDIMRAALIMKHLEKAKDIKVIFIWSGQHYSYNMKGVWFKQLNMRKPDYDLGCRGESDAEISSKLISKLSPLLEKIKPDAVAFLGDTNTTVGCIAAAQLNIPIIHIEGCWHSYDWRMPEEKYRTMIDHLADVIYTYEEEYKVRGIIEGLNPKNIVVVKNPVVDIINVYYFKQKDRLEKRANKDFFKKRGIKDGKYFLMTCHRRENVHIEKSFLTIMNMIKEAPLPVYFSASYRTQKVMKELKNKGKLKEIKNLIVVDPTSYEEILILITHAKAVFTDSGTMVEETSILNVPTVQIRKATERPQVYDTGGCIKFDPAEPEIYTPELIFKKLNKIYERKWKHNLGDGKSSERIAKDLIKRLRTGKLRGHEYKDLHLPYQRSIMEDVIKV
jgi:UDP-N-acetylglucosamine 2-epimerase (non-hydrolysing)